MKILLIYPPLTTKRNEALAVTPPLGLAYLAAVAEQMGHEVKILDTVVLWFKHREQKGHLIEWSPKNVIKRNRKISTRFSWNYLSFQSNERRNETNGNTC